MFRFPGCLRCVIQRGCGSGKSSLAFDTIYAEGQRPLRGIVPVAYPSVPGTDAEARCGLHRRPLSGDFPSTEDDQSQTPRSTVGTSTGNL